nr:auxin response factor 9-like [Ipomoea batatas]
MYDFTVGTFNRIRETKCSNCGLCASVEDNAGQTNGMQDPLQVTEGQPRRHLLTTGWSNFVSSKRLVAGDSFLLLRGENGELRVGIRHHAQKQNSIPSSVISSRNMHLGVLATASHAVTTKTLFVVNYKPRMSQFIVGLRKYKEAVNQGFLVGMRFKMRFEVEDSPERRSYDIYFLHSGLRAVDLTAIKGYDELTSELEDMFEIHGELRPRKKWEIVFTDDEGDTMLMGDHPWLEFCSVVRRILIFSNTEVKKTSAGNTPPSSVSESITVNDRNVKGSEY